MIKRTIILGLACCFAATLVACDSKKDKSDTKVKIVTAKLQTPTTHLYFSGTIQPVSTMNIFSPVDGRIEKLNFMYGQNVKQHQVLAVINSIKLMSDFRTAVSDYLTKKNAYINQVKSFQGTQALYKAGVIDLDDFDNAQNGYENSVLSFFQQEYQLTKVLRLANISASVIEKLNITQIGEIKKLFAKQFNHIKVLSSQSGVALFPLPSQSQSSSDSSDQGDGQVAVGSQIREGQLILSVGDLSGFSIAMNVSEVNINNIHSGLHAIITGDAFPGIALKGMVTYVASQAQPSDNSSGISNFSVVVKVPKISVAANKLVHVGMSAKVDLPITGKPEIMLPVAAVFQKNGVSYVTTKDAAGNQKLVRVVTGPTTLASVSIISGIQAGQQVVIHD